MSAITPAALARDGSRRRRGSDSSRVGVGRMLLDRALARHHDLDGGGSRHELPVKPQGNWRALQANQFNP